MVKPKKSAKYVKDTPYHHGDLRAVLLRAVDELVARTGVEGLTLRAIARHAGVSHGAPARHFPRLMDLLTEYAAEAFVQLAEAMDVDLIQLPDNPLLATGLGYIRFAVENPARFRLMFRRDWLDVSSPRLQAATQEAYMRLVDALAKAYEQENREQLDQATLRLRATLAWSAVHGYATLLSDERFGRGLLVDPKSLLEALRPSLLSLHS